MIKNLRYNAARHAKRDMNQLLVDDDGPGIPDKDRHRVFESFVQLDDSGKKAGYGLGLAIVKRAMNPCVKRRLQKTTLLYKIMTP